MAQLHVQRKRNNYWWLWLVLILIIVAAGIYYYVNYYKKNATDAPTTFIDSAATSWLNGNKIFKIDPNI